MAVYPAENRTPKTTSTSKSTNTRRLQREQGMNLMVGVILVDYIVFTMPALVVMEIDMTAAAEHPVRCY